MSFKTDIDLKTSLVVDFMSLTRRLPLEKKSDFVDLFNVVWDIIKNTCKFRRVDVVVLDSHLEVSIKEGE